MSDFCIFRGGSVKMNSDYFLNYLNAEGNSLLPHFRLFMLMDLSPCIAACVA